MPVLYLTPKLQVFGIGVTNRGPGEMMNNNNLGNPISSVAYLDEKLHRFCQDGNLEELRSYLSHGMTGRVNHRESANGDTPLHHASR